MTAKKAKAKKTATKKTAAKTDGVKKVGVIATIIEEISKAKGATADEVLAVLVKRFPDRDADGMRKTILIQAAKNCSSKDRDEARGLVYFRRGR
jgi:hypothetical protein